MPKPKQSKFAKVEGFTGLFSVAIPLLVLLATAFLHWTMQVFLEPNLLMRLVKLVGLPFYILAVVLAPPLLIAWGMHRLFRRSDTVFGVVLILLVLVWGFWYMIPPIVENWDVFMRFVEDFGAV